MKKNYKKSMFASGIISALILILSSTTAAQNSQQSVRGKRVRECFDPDWMFHKGDIAIRNVFNTSKYGGLTDINVKVVSDETSVIDYTDVKKLTVFKPADWQKVDLPHDWLVEVTFVNDNSLGIQPASNGYLPVGIGFYRKEFGIPETDKGKKISIEFDGIFRNSTVWVNGNLMGNHLSGYTPSNYDLTDYLRYGDEGKNVVLVKVDARDYEGWWYEGCGIYRHVWLIKTGKLHVERFGTYITTPVVSDLKADVEIKTTLKNEYNLAKSITLISKIADNKNVIIDTRTISQTVAPFSQTEISQTGLIQKPLLWSPETPNLYKVLTEVIENGSLIDTYETTFGVRTIEITNNGFYLNGKLYPVKGTANHQDFAGVGVALPDKLNEYKIKLLKEMGSNGYRCAHNPPTPELLDACDRLGMLVLDENRIFSSTRDGLNNLTELLLRDRNHPSVFMWCMENEESVQGTVMGTRLVTTLVETTHRIDPTRPATAAINGAWNEGGFSDALDVMGYNYGQRGMQYVKDREKFPQRKMFATESTSFVSTRGEYEDNKEKGYVSNLGKGVPWGVEPGKDWEDIVQYPYLSGMFAWTGFDYRGEPTPYRWPCVTSHFGIMDLCGFPKDGYYAYTAAWNNKPVVHIFPHWNWPGKEGKSMKVQGYSNCEEVELFVNGKSAGKKKVIPFNKLVWDVVYKPGKVEARGYNKGRAVAKDIVETTTAPAQITLDSDCSILKADGCDVAVIRVAIKDAMGRVVPVADNLVKFSIEGPGRIIGTGNGNPSSHEPDKANQRMAFNGFCLVLVQTDRTAGEIRLKASSEKLKEAEVILKADMLK
jgi:beta-galactosidase